MRAFTGNTVPYKTEWIKAYQETHYKQPVFPVFADQRFEDVLTQGASYAWSYDGDADVAELGSDGSYQVANKTVTDETLTVNKVPASTFRIPATQKIQDHRDTQQKWAMKSMNRIFWWIDAQMLYAMQIAAATILDASDAQFGGSASGTPITATVQNVPSIFTAARRLLKNQNVIYDANKKYTGYVKLDRVAKYPAAAIPAELEELILLAVGFKPGDMGDQVLREGYLNMLFGFNTFTSTALPFTVKLTQTGTPTDQDTVVVGSNTWKFVTGTPTDPGDVKAETDANTSMTNLANAINSPYTSISGKHVAFTRATVAASSLAKAFILDMSVASTPSGGAFTLTIKGHGRQTVSATGSGMALSNQAVHAIFGTSQSISMVMQRYPELSVSAGQIIGNGTTGGVVAQDFVTWALAGWKVFKTQTFQLIDVPISTTNYQNPQSVLY
jgi:hypothetical protein